MLGPALLTLFVFTASSIAAPDVDPWSAVPWGRALPEGAKPEHDHPWAGADDARCGWLGEVLACEGAGGVDRAYRRVDTPVPPDATRWWLRTAGLEWTEGGWVSLPAPEGYSAFRWSQSAPPVRGWEGLLRVEPAGSPAEAAPTLTPTPVTLSAPGLPGEALAPMAAALSGCGLTTVGDIPAAVLYDPAGRARMVRYQRFPLEDPGLECASAVLGGLPAPSAGGQRELVLTVGDGPAPGR